MMWAYPSHVLSALSANLVVTESTSSKRFASLGNTE